MDWKKEWKVLATMVAVFLGCFYLPLDNIRFRGAVVESLYLVKWYAREHVLLCLVPAFFIAGGIATFIAQGSVMKYLGAGANKVLAYGVASVSGTILAVCSCTVLPLFAGIHRRGAGLGPAITFLYSGPAINVLAIILTARVLGWQLGVARAAGAIIFSIIIGLIMAGIYQKEEIEKLPPVEKRLLTGTLMTREITAEGIELFDAENFNQAHFGQLLTRQQEVIRDYLQISVPKIDRMIDTALKTGALGAKLNGSGEGGCMFAYTPGKSEEVFEALKKLGAKPFIVLDDEGVRTHET